MKNWLEICGKKCLHRSRRKVIFKLQSQTKTTEKSICCYSNPFLSLHIPVIQPTAPWNTSEFMTIVWEIFKKYILWQHFNPGPFPWGTFVPTWLTASIFEKKGVHKKNWKKVNNFTERITFLTSEKTVKDDDMSVLTSFCQYTCICVHQNMFIV